jgi:peroxiredoxin
VEDLLLDLQVLPLDGQTPPGFTLESLDGRKVSLRDFLGKPVLLYFWATW